MWALAHAHRRLDDLDGPLADSVRRHVGYSVSKDTVLATPAVEDVWTVLGVVDTEEDRLLTRRAWLYGHRTQRYALLLDFAPPGVPLPGRPPVGSAASGTLHYYPGALAQRALVAGELTAVEPVRSDMPGFSVADARQALAHAVAADPWLTSIPVAVRGRLGTAADVRVIVDDAGMGIALTVQDWFTALAISRGEPITVFGELTRGGIAALSLSRDGQVWSL